MYTKQLNRGGLRHRSRNMASLLRFNFINRRTAAQPAGARAATSSAKAVVRRAGAGTRSTAKSRGAGRDRAGSAAASFTRRFAPGVAGGETKKYYGLMLSLKAIGRLVIRHCRIHG